MLKLAVVAASAVVAVSAVPQLPIDYTTYEMDELAVYQGDYTANDDFTTYSCDAFANCKVQTEAQAGKTYMAASLNVTRFEPNAAGVALISDYNAMKAYQTDLNLNCQSYCPLTGTIYPLAVDASATDNGPVTVDGKTYESWSWGDDLGPLVMDTNTVLVDNTDPNNPIPFRNAEHLTPFNMDIGRFSSEYNGFVAGTPDPALFAVIGADACPLGDNCDSDQEEFFRNVRHHNRKGAHMALSHALRKQAHREL